MTEYEAYLRAHNHAMLNRNSTQNVKEIDVPYDDQTERVFLAILIGSHLGADKAKRNSPLTKSELATKISSFL